MGVGVRKGRRESGPGPERGNPARGREGDRREGDGVGVGRSEIGVGGRKNTGLLVSGGGCRCGRG